MVLLSDNVPFSQLIGEAIMLDLTCKRADEEITAHDLEQTGSEVGEGDIVLLHTGWDRWWGNREKYFWHSPYLATDASQWLVARKIASLGFDIPCPDNMNDLRLGEPPPIHVMLLGNNIILVEMLCNLDSIGRRRFPFIVLPLKYKDMDGAAARAIALLP